MWHEQVVSVLKKQILETLGEHPQVPSGEIKHIKTIVRRDNTPGGVLTQMGRKRVCS